MNNDENTHYVVMDKARDTKALCTALTIAWFVGMWSEQNFDLMVFASLGAYILIRIKQVRGQI